MEWQKNGEWTGFAIGIVLAFILWTYLHSMDNRGAESTAELATFTVISTETESANQSDKPANGQQTTHTPADSGIASTSNANSDTSSGSRADSRTGHTAGSDLAQSQLSVHVYLTGEQRTETVPLETYVRGVVAAEMPSGFEPAALEAQAMAARTYIVRRLLEHDNSNVPVPGAEVTDTQTHQVYRSLSDMQQLRSRNPQAWRKVDDAATNTEGRIITYQGRPIQALYFSASNGYTENSEDVFPFSLPYLRSVASPWDQQQPTPSATDTTEMPIDEFYAKLGIRSIPTLLGLGGTPRLKVTEWTNGKRIKSLTVGAKTFTGQEVRELLKLRSSSFSWEIKSNKIIFTTHGNGHGVGMSQWGAEGMAQSGHTAEQIVKYYYSGAEIMEVSKLAHSS
jgi:stage II sporulation protein D